MFIVKEGPAVAVDLCIPEFSDEYLNRAASLFCSQFRKQRLVTPVLPATYSRMEKVVSLIARLSRDAQGVAAFKGSELVGYLIGVGVSGLMSMRDGAYCPQWAHGAATEDRKGVYRSMYKVVAKQWVARGRLVHCITHLADDVETDEAFRTMGFGITTIDAMMVSRQLSKSHQPGLRVRPIDADEIDDIVPLSEDLEKHLETSPSFMPRPMRHWREYYLQFLSRKDSSIWVAYKEGRAVSFMRCEPSTEPGACQVARDPRVLKISGAYTIPNLRGMGIATAVLSKLLAASRANYPRCSVDFESTNLLAYDFWLKRFTPVCYTMARHIDERILPFRS
jgi:ribosomal protein S18 acetylase RimI-like enzyme